MDVAVCYPVPFNKIMGTARDVWWWLKKRNPSVRAQWAATIRQAAYTQARAEIYRELEAKINFLEFQNMNMREKLEAN